MRGKKWNKGFTVLEIMIVIAAIGFVIALLVPTINFGDRASGNLASKLLSDYGAVEVSFSNFLSDKNIYPTGLTDAGYAGGIYLYPPKSPDGFDSAYSTNGYNLALQTGQAVGLNGYYVCAKVVVADSNDLKWKALTIATGKTAASKFYYNTACPSTSNAAAPAASTTLYPTYWLTRY